MAVVFSYSAPMHSVAAAVFADCRRGVAAIGFFVGPLRLQVAHGARGERLGLVLRAGRGAWGGKGKEDEENAHRLRVGR